MFKSAEDAHSVTFFVVGEPRGAGSKRAFPHKSTGKMVYLDMDKYSRQWKETIHRVAKTIWAGRPLLTGPVRLDVEFGMPRPKTHYLGDKPPTPKKYLPLFKTTTKDRTKLLRALEDGLTGAILEDDALVVAGETWKFYSLVPGALIRITPLEPISDEWWNDASTAHEELRFHSEGLLFAKGNVPPAAKPQSS